MSGWERDGTKPKTFVLLLDKRIIEMKVSKRIFSHRFKGGEKIPTVTRY